MKYVVPNINETEFTCPHCGVLAKQKAVDRIYDSLPAKSRDAIADRDSKIGV